jgi:hypothetical protein
LIQVNVLASGLGKIGQKPISREGAFPQGGSAMEGTAGLPKGIKDERCWRGFAPGRWRNAIDVRDFILHNVTPYEGDEGFLAAPTARTKAVWEKLRPYFRDEQKKGVLAVDAKTPSTMPRTRPAISTATTR